MKSSALRRPPIALLACVLAVSTALRADDSSFPPDRPLPAQQPLDPSHWTGLVPTSVSAATVTLLGHDGAPLAWKQEPDALVITCPDTTPFATAVSFRIVTR